MSITSIMRDWGVYPSIVRITATNTLAEVAATGYITSQDDIIQQLNNGVWEWLVGDMIAMSASDGNNIFCFDGNDFATLVLLPSSGGGGAVLLDPPADQTIVNHNLILEKGALVSGSDGNQGSVLIFPTTSNTGALFLIASPSGGNFNTTVTNAAMGQITSMTITDPGANTGHFLVAGGATPFVIGNFPMNSTTDGRMVDSGVAVSTLQGLANRVQYIDFDITAAALAMSGTSFIIPAVPGESFKIRNFMVNLSTGFSGGGGDRNVILTDGSGILVNIAAALAGTPINTLWGGTDLDFASSLPQNVTTFVGGGLWFQYFGGTTDYTDGTITVTLAYEQIT